MLWTGLSPGTSIKLAKIEWDEVRMASAEEVTIVEWFTVNYYYSPWTHGQDLSGVAYYGLFCSASVWPWPLGLTFPPTTINHPERIFGIPDNLWGSSCGEDDPCSNNICYVGSGPPLLVTWAIYENPSSADMLMLLRWTEITIWVAANSSSQRIVINQTQRHNGWPKKTRIVLNASNSVTG